MYTYEQLALGLKYQIKDVTSMLVGLISTIGLNIVSRRMLHFALSVICLRRKLCEAIVLLKNDLEIGIGMTPLTSMWVV